MRASSLPLLTKCTGSLVLSCTSERSKNADDAADWGTMVHHWVQTGEILGRDKRSEKALARAIELSGIDRLSFWPVGGTHEGGLALRVDGVAREANRDDTPRDGWITGHFDYQWWLWGGELWVDDLKTGKFYANPEPGQMGHVAGLASGENRFPPRADSEQQRFYGLTLSRLLGYRGPVHTSVTHWPRLPLTHRHAPPTRTWHHYSRDELSYYYGELESMYSTHKQNERALVGDGELTLNSGTWCRFCPARNNCLMREEA
jgi:hypothetical protein